MKVRRRKPDRTKIAVVVGLLTGSLAIAGVASSSPAAAANKPVAHVLPASSDVAVAGRYDPTYGLYVATTPSGSAASATVPFTFDVSTVGDTGSSSLTESAGGPSKTQLLATVTKDGVTGFNIKAARGAIAAGWSMATATRMWGGVVGRVVGAIRSGANTATIERLANPSTSGLMTAATGDSTGCAGKTPLDPISAGVNNNEIQIQYASYGCLDYVNGADWYVVEKSVESYATKSYALYFYAPQQEGIRQQHQATSGPNRYIDWDPSTTTGTQSGCHSEGLSISPISGLGYNISETLCDGSFNPYICPGATSCAPAAGEYAGSMFYARTIGGIVQQDQNTWYGNVLLLTCTAHPARRTARAISS